MPQPTKGDVHVNRPLTNISIAYIQKAINFIGARVFPVVPVEKQSDRYFSYSREDWFRDEAVERAPSAESAGGGYDLDNTPTYACIPYAFHKDVDDQIRANSDIPLNPDRDATQFVTDKLLIRREVNWASKYFATTLWTTERAGVAAGPAGTQFLRWDVANSTPIDDITDAIIVIAELTGYRPNKLVVSPHVYNTLRNHATILDRVKYTQRGIITPEILAPLFDVEEVLIPWAVKNTAAKKKTGSYSFIMGKHALLIYAAPAPSLMAPSAGYTFSWTGYLGAGREGNRIKSFRMEELSSDRIEGEMAFDQKMVAADLGAFFKDAVS